jgi:hypothetical protein
LYDVLYDVGACSGVVKWGSAILCLPAVVYRKFFCKRGATKRQ